MRLAASILIALLVVCGAIAAPSQPVNFLHQVSERYRHLRSFDLFGHLTATIPGTAVRVRVEAEDAMAGHSFVPANSSLVKYGQLGQAGNITFADTHGNPVAFKSNVDVPGGWGSFDLIDQGVKTATELPSQTIEVHGVSCHCRVFQVEYTDANKGHDPGEHSYKYWIDPTRLVVVKEEFEMPEGRPAVSWRWTYTIDSARLNQPPPQWLVDVANQFAKPTEHPRPEWVGRVAPSFVLSDPNGHQIDSSSMRNSVVLLDFWATSCAPCRRELPIVEKVSQDYKSQGVRMLGVSFDDDPATVRKWMSENHKQFPTVVDTEGKAAAKFDVQAFPSLVVIASSGKVTSYYVGEQTEQSLRSAINSALHESAPKSR